MQSFFIKKSLSTFLFFSVVSLVSIVTISILNIHPQTVHAQAEGGSDDAGSDAENEAGGVGDVNDGTPADLSGYNPVPGTPLDIIVSSPTCLNNSKAVIVSYNLHNTYPLYSDGVTLCGGSRVSVGGTSQVAGCVNSGSSFSNLSGVQTISLEMKANGIIPGDNSWQWSREYFPLIDWSTNGGMIPDGQYVLAQTKTIDVNGADNPGNCSLPATPVINAVASGCTLPAGGGTCNMTISWTSNNTNSGLVDIIMLRPDGTNTGLTYASKAANGSLTIATSLPGNHVFGVYNHGTGFSTSDVYASANAMVNTQGYPPAPVSMGAYCNSGTSATLTWPAAPGATVYYPRVAPIAQSVCSSINWKWTSENGGTCYTDRWPYGTGVANFPVVAGVQYSAWVHSGDPVDYTKAAGTSFKCENTTTNAHETNGYFDALSCSAMTGWAYDADVPTTAINVRVWDTVTQNGVSASSLLGTYSTNVYDANLNTLLGAPSGSHRFSIPTPASIKDGKTHWINIYAVDPASGKTKQLTQSPRSVVCDTKADLTVSGITPTSAVVGVPTTFSARVTNTGNGSTNIGFKNFFQVRKTTIVAAAPGGFLGWLITTARAATTETITDLPSISLGALGTGAYGTVLQTYTFPDNTSEYAMRVCADKADSNGTNGNPNGEIPESDETNNCGGWTNINVTSLCADAGDTCTATNKCGMSNTGVIDSACNCSVSAPSDSLCPADRAPYGYFDSSPTDSCTTLTGWAIDPDVETAAINVHVYSGTSFIGSYTTNQLRSDVNTNQGVTGTHGFNVPTPSALKTGTAQVVHIYAINNNSYGNNTELNFSPKTITCYPEPVLSLVPSATRVREGNPVDLNWYAKNVTSCTLTGPDVSESQTATGGGNVGTSGTPKKTTTNVSGQSTYTLTCKAQSDGKNRSVSATVTAIPVFIER